LLDALPHIISGNSVTGRAGQPFHFKVLTDNAGAGYRLHAAGLPYAEGRGQEIRLDPATDVLSGFVPLSLDGSPRTFGVGLNIMGADLSQSHLQLTFVSDPLFPVITSDSVAILVLNQFFSYTITADAPVSCYSYIGLDGALNGELPSGLAFDPATGTISGIFTNGSTSGGPIPWGRKGSGFPGPATIKKEPPPKIQNMAQRNGIGTGTLPLNFLIGAHDFEIETLTTTPSSETSYLIATDDPIDSGLGVGVLQSARIGDYVSYAVPVARPGTYDVRIGFRADQEEGIFQLAINGANQGPPQDEYASVKSYKVIDLGPITFPLPLLLCWK
jgi:hypothetical protein